MRRSTTGSCEASATHGARDLSRPLSFGQMPPSDTPATPVERALESVNAGYVAEMQERWQQDPASVDPEWRALFEPPIASPAAEPHAPGLMPAAEEAPVAPLPEGATLLRGPAARLARNMTASLAVPTATSFRDVPVATLEARRRELLAQMAPRRVSFTHLIGWAIVRAAAAMPGMTNYYLEGDGAAHRVDPGGVHLGLARCGVALAMRSTSSTKTHVQHAVGFIEDQHFGAREVDEAAFQMVDQTTRRGDQNIHGWTATTGSAPG